MFKASLSLTRTSTVFTHGLTVVLFFHSRAALNDHWWTKRQTLNAFTGAPASFGATFVDEPFVEPVNSAFWMDLDNTKKGIIDILR